MTRIDESLLSWRAKTPGTSGDDLSPSILTALWRLSFSYAVYVSLDPEMGEDRLGDWLSAPGEYQDLVHRLCAADPRLRRRDPKADRQKTPWPNQTARLVALEMGSDGAFSKPTEHDPQSLKEYLNNQVISSNVEHGSRLFILEGLRPEFIAAFGNHFKMHPSLFTEHERVVVMAPSALMEDDAVVLPGMTGNREHYILKYYEPLHLPEKVHSIFRMCCAVSGRHIGITRARGFFSEVGILRRKCSIRRRKRVQGLGWDCKSLRPKPLGL